MEIFFEKIASLPGKLRAFDILEIFHSSKKRTLLLLEQIKNIGVEESMDEYEKRKLTIFNQLNFFQLLTGILVPIIGLIHSDQLPASAWLIACLPSCISITVLLFNYLRKYESAQLSYFILYPFFTGFVYLKGMNMGVELHFILYGVLAVFFLQDMGYMLFAIALSMVNYFVLSVVLKEFQYEVKLENRFLYFFNHLLALGFIFYGLFLIKKENTEYQFKILAKQTALHKKNLEIKKTKGSDHKKSQIIADTESRTHRVKFHQNKIILRNCT